MSDVRPLGIVECRSLTYRSDHDIRPDRPAWAAGAALAAEWGFHDEALRLAFRIITIGFIALFVFTPGDGRVKEPDDF